jgi:hypothetical protein
MIYHAILDFSEVYKNRQCPREPHAGMQSGRKLAEGDRVHIVPL